MKASCYNYRLIGGFEQDYWIPAQEIYISTKQIRYINFLFFLKKNLISDCLSHLFVNLYLILLDF